MIKGGGSDRRVILRGLFRYLTCLLLVSPIGKVYWRLQRGLRFQWGNYMTMHFVGNFVEAQCLNYGVDSYSGLPNVSRCDGPIESDSSGLNPDQRIASDVETFAQLSTGLTLDVLQAVIDLYFQVSLLRKLSPALSKVVLCAAIIATACSLSLGRNLRELYDKERSAAGDFLYTLTRLRENAESIAFYRGQEREVGKLAKKLVLRQNAEWMRFALKDVLQTFTSVYRSVAGLLPAYILAAHSGSGGGTTTGTDVGLVTQASESFGEVLGNLLVFTYNTSDFNRLAALGLELHRYHLRSLAATSRCTNSCETQRGIQLKPAVPPSWIRIDKLSICTPGLSRRYMLRDLSIEMPTRGGLLITGQSGVGKTTLLRAIAGMWRSGEGTIWREFDPQRVLFLPQRPYMELGSLREQLLYPSSGSAPLPDTELRDIIVRVGLAHVLQRCGGDFDIVKRWTEELSVGEQQRISIARVLVNKPRYVILDETTSANDLAHEKTMYECVVSTCQAFVSIGHRESIEAFHCKKLVLFGDAEDGRWVLEDIQSS